MITHYYPTGDGRKFHELDLCSWVGCDNFGGVEFYRGEGDDKQHTWVCFEHAEKMETMTFEDAVSIEKSGTLLWNTRKLFADPELLERRVQKQAKAFGL